MAKDVTINETETKERLDRLVKWANENRPKISTTPTNEPKNVSLTPNETQTQALVDWVVQNQKEIIIKEEKGEPAAVILPYAEYLKLQELKEKARRESLLAQLEAIRQDVSSRNQDLTQDEAEALADRFVREVLNDMIAEGKIKFESFD